MSRRLVLLLLVGSYAAWLGADFAVALQTDRTAGTVNRSVLVADQGRPLEAEIKRLGPNGTTWEYTNATGRIFDIDQLPGDRLLLAFTRSTPPRTVTGVRIIGRNKTTRWQWTMPIDDAANAEIHDADVLPSGRILLADMVHERVLILARNGSVVWQWNASRFYDTPEEPTEHDWLHINDVDRIGEGRYLISVRNANQLVIVTRGQGVTEVINRDRTSANDRNCRLDSGYRDEPGDGDASVRCGDPTVLDHQHNPQWLGNGRVLVADSGNDRIVELARRNGSWRPVWTRTAAGGIRFDWPRDADRLRSGATLVTDTRNDRVVLLRPNGSMAWSVYEPGYVYEAEHDGEYPAGPPNESSSGAGPPQRVPRWATLIYGLVTWYVPVPYWVGEWQVIVGLGIGIAIVSTEVVATDRVPTPDVAETWGSD